MRPQSADRAQHSTNLVCFQAFQFGRRLEGQIQENASGARDLLQRRHGGTCRVNGQGQCAAARPAGTGARRGKFTWAGGKPRRTRWATASSPPGTEERRGDAAVSGLCNTRRGSERMEMNTSSRAMRPLPRRSRHPALFSLQRACTSGESTGRIRMGVTLPGSERIRPRNSSRIARASCDSPALQIWQARLCTRPRTSTWATISITAPGASHAASGNATSMPFRVTAETWVSNEVSAAAARLVGLVWEFVFIAFSGSIAAVLRMTSRLRILPAGSDSPRELKTSSRTRNPGKEASSDEFELAIGNRNCRMPAPVPSVMRDRFQLERIAARRDHGERN